MLKSEKRLEVSEEYIRRTLQKNASGNLHEFLQPRFQAIDAKRRVGQGFADAILAESAGMDFQFSEHRENGRWLKTVALQFYDGEPGKRTFLTCSKILKREVGIDGEPLGHRLVHQRDAMETVLNLLLQQLRVNVQYLLQEILSRGIICRNTALISLAMIVLGLYFQETQLAVYIRAHTHLLSACMSVMMGVVEGVIF